MDSSKKLDTNTPRDSEKLTPDEFRARYMKPLPEEEEIPEGDTLIIFGKHVANPDRSS